MTPDSRGSYLKGCASVVVAVAGASPSEVDTASEAMCDSVAASAISERGSVVMPWIGARLSAGTLAAGL